MYLRVLKKHKLAGMLQKLLDVGAGMGFHSLAAAATGWQVEAFESGQLDLLSFQASRAYNGFKEAVRIHQVSPSSLKLAHSINLTARLRHGRRGLSSTSLFSRSFVALCTLVQVCMKYKVPTQSPYFLHNHSSYATQNSYRWHN